MENSGIQKLKKIKKINKRNKNNIQIAYMQKIK